MKGVQYLSMYLMSDTGIIPSNCFTSLVALTFSDEKKLIQYRLINASIHWLVLEKYFGESGPLQWHHNHGFVTRVPLSVP